jgi:formate dehydrogenase major subunit
MVRIMSFFGKEGFNMDVTRRDFLKISGAATAGLMLGSLFDLAPIEAYAAANPPEWDTVTTSICCYCAVGCGLLVCTNSSDPDAVYVQGDPDHPINQGTLCSKGQAIGQLHTVDGAVNPKRMTAPMKRTPGATSWTTISWTQAINEIAAHIKTTRDGPNTHYTGTDPNSPAYNTTLEEWIDVDPAFGGPDWYPVNRCTGIACLGGAAHDTEECYLLVKLMRALGLVYIEHQARI